MQNVFLHKARLKADEDEKKIQKLHFGKTEATQNTSEMLALGRENREGLQSLSAGRFDEWVGTAVQERKERNDLEGPVTAANPSYVSVHWHKFRDREKHREKQICDREWGVNYETEKQRIERVAEDHRLNQLEREAWSRNQHAPRARSPCHKPTGSGLRNREFTDAERLRESIAKSTFDMHIGTQFKEVPICPEWRPRHPEEGGRAKVMNYGVPQSGCWGGGAWTSHGAPVDESALPVVTSPRSSRSARTRSDFDPKMDGRSRLDFSLGRTIEDRVKSLAPERRRKVFHNSLRSFSCSHRAGTGALVGDNEIKRGVFEILRSR